MYNPHLYMYLYGILMTLSIFIHFFISILKFALRISLIIEYNPTLQLWVKKQL